MKVLKFGGTSVKDAKAINQTINVIRQSTNVRAVVVSAFGGVTDEILRLIEYAKTSSEKNSLEKSIHTLKERHIDTAHELGVTQEDEFLTNIFDELHKLLIAVQVLGQTTKETESSLASFGEKLSSFIIYKAVEARRIDCSYLNGKNFITTIEQGDRNVVDVVKTHQQINETFTRVKTFAILPGFISHDANNRPTTLGRGGSDYTAALVASALSAESLEIWTDVSGMLTADPRIVTDAFVLDEITFDEAMELCHFGAKVLYPPTLLPVKEKEIPLYIKNTFQIEDPGTKIVSKTTLERRTITGITSLRDVSLFTLKGPGLTGIPGSLNRLFSALSKKDISIILVTQASSEQSICFAIRNEHSAVARRSLLDEFQFEFESNKLEALDVDNEACIVSVVGNEMIKTPGVAASVFVSLASSNINIVAIAQGSTEKSISCVIDKADETNALKAIHNKFFLDLKTIHVFIIGLGQVGTSLTRQLHNQMTHLKSQYRLDMKLIGASNSKKYILEENSIAFDKAKSLLDEKGKCYGHTDEILKVLLPLKISNIVVIDCSASPDLSNTYKELLYHKISVITSNKKVQTESQEFFDELHQISKKYETPFRYETSVGAALPILSTLREIQMSGDKVLKIEATLSGTLGYIFSKFIEGEDFSEIVMEAKQMGYTEPDPRDDLSGLDVARKLLILIRSSGYKYSMDNIKIGEILPTDCMNVESVEIFLKELSHATQSLEDKRDRAVANNKKIQYLASFDGEKGNVELKEISADSPFFALEGTDNMIALYTERYSEAPLVIRGAGAGPDITASGVFTDLMRAVQRKGVY